MRYAFFCLFFLTACGAPPWAQAPDAGHNQQPHGDDFPAPVIDVAGPPRQIVAPNARGIPAGSLLISKDDRQLLVTAFGFVIVNRDGLLLKPGDVALAGDLVATDGTGAEVLRLRADDPWLYGAPSHCSVTDGIIGPGCFFDDINESLHRLPFMVQIGPGAPAKIDFAVDTDWRVRDDQSYRIYFMAVVSQRPEDFSQYVISMLFGFATGILEIRDPTTFCDPISGGLYGFGGCCGTHTPMPDDGHVPAYSLVQRENEPGVAQLGYDGKLRPFRSSYELTSWTGLNGPNGFPDALDHLLCNRVISLPAAIYNAKPRTRTVALRPGLHVAETPNGQLYVVARGRTLRPVVTAAAAAIYPDSLGSRIVPIPTEALADYVMGPPAHGPGDYDAATEYQLSFIENETQ